MNVLGVELRRSAALGAALITLAVGTAALYTAPRRWADGWMSLALAERSYTILLWPLALAAGAWQGRRDHRSRMGELLATTSRPAAQRVAPVLGSMGVTTAIAYLIVAVGGIGWIINTAHYRPLGTFLVVTTVGALSLVAAAWLGLGLGRMLPALVTAPALAVAGTVLMPMAALLIEPDWLAATVAPTHDTDSFFSWQTVDNRVSAAQAIWMIALAGAGALLFASRNGRTRVMALLPVVLGLGAAIVVVPRGSDYVELPADPVARELVCADGAPEVCVSRVKSNVLAELVPLAREGLARLAKLPDPPTAVHEDTSMFVRRELPVRQAGVVTIEIEIDEHGGLGHPELVVYYIVNQLRFGGDLQCRKRNGAVERAAVYWLMGREPVSDVGFIPGTISEDSDLNPKAVELWRGLKALPDSEALARVAAVRRAILACQDSTDLLSRSAVR